MFSFTKSIFSARGRLLAGAMALALASVGTMQSAQAAALPKVSPLSLGTFQAESGLIQTFNEGLVADPYFGLYALDLAEKAGLDVSVPKEKFIKWGLQAQREDGRFFRYCRPTVKAAWASCGVADSDDAVLARWTHLLATARPASQRPAAWADSIARADKALMRLRMDNGVFSVFPPEVKGYAGYALFKDNVEVLSSFEQLATHFEGTAEPEPAQMYLERAKSLRAAMAQQFGDKPFDMKRLALGATYRGWQFYPHAVSIPFGWMEGYYPKPTPQEWSAWLERYTQDWLTNAEKDFPWGVLALSAMRTGPQEVAGCWLQRHKPQQKSHDHWNILEEVTAQAIQAKGIAPTNCPKWPSAR